VRIVLDTNIWVSGLLWKGLPWRLLRLAEQKKVELCTAAPVLAELYEVLSYERLQPRLQSGLDVGRPPQCSPITTGQANAHPLALRRDDSSLCQIGSVPGKHLQTDLYLLASGKTDQAHNPRVRPSLKEQ